MSFPDPAHNHEECIARLLRNAEQRCLERGVRLTKQRRLVFKAIARSHHAMGAYDILEDLMLRENIRLAPVSIYRTLEFLMTQGLVHRIESLNAFTACTHNGDECSGHEGSGGSFLICHSCGDVIELSSGPIQKAIHQEAMAAGFHIDNPVVEIKGSCPYCTPEDNGKKKIPDDISAPKLCEKQ